MISREELYKLVWSMPMIKVAEQFGVSGSYMARVCSILRVPRPERGYWAKLLVGKAPTPRPLPEAQPGDQLYWSKDTGLNAAPKPEPSVQIKRRRTTKNSAPRTGVHSLILGAKAHFESGRQVEESDYLRPYKKLLVDVTASKASLDKALEFANDLFNALESVGHRVMIAPPQRDQFRRGEADEREHPKKQRDYYYSRLWSPFRPTVVYIGTVAIGLIVLEMSEEVLMRYVSGKYVRDSDYVPPKSSRRYLDHTWTTTKELPCGRLRLIVYSPYWEVKWSTNWQETKDAPLTKKLPAIVKAIETGAADLVEKLKEAERRAEIARLERLAEEERRRREEDRRKVDQSIKDSRSHLSQIIQAWSDIMNVERFLQEVQDHAEALPTDERNAVHERLALAREFLGSQNPLDFFLSWKTPLERYQPLSHPGGSMPNNDPDSKNN